MYLLLHYSIKGIFSKSFSPRLFLIDASLPLHLTHAHTKNGFTPKACMKFTAWTREKWEKRKDHA
jgi:hypothetical protein